MAETTTTRFGLKRWSADTDTPERTDFDGAHAALATNAAGWLPLDVAANRPTASAANERFLFRATDTGALSFSTGSTWVEIPQGFSAASLLSRANHTGTQALSTITGHTKAVHDSLAIDHGSLTGNADDDHTQYLNNTRHNALDHSTALGTAVLSDLSDVTITSIAAGEIPTWSGTAWVNQTLAEAGIATAGHGHPFSDHGSLTGLSSDDHPQYVLASGTRAFTGEVEFPNGSLGTPAMRFSNDLDTGLYLPSAGLLGIAVNGTAGLTVGPNAITVGDGSVNAVAVINGANLTERDVTFQTNGSNRWSLRVEATNEAGSNAGSDFAIVSRDDSGTVIGSAMTINRATRVATFPTGLQTSVIQIGSSIIGVDEFQGSNGSNLDPTYTFTNDLDTGMYLDATAVLGWSTAGVERMLLGTDLIVSADTVPGVDSTYDLGLSSFYWRNIYGQQLILKGNESGSDKVIAWGRTGYDVFMDNVGSGSAGRLWFDTPNGGEIVLGPRGGSSFLNQLRVRGAILVDGQVVPEDHLTRNLGSSGSAWNIIYYDVLSDQSDFRSKDDLTPVPASESESVLRAATSGDGVQTYRKILGPEVVKDGKPGRKRRGMVAQGVKQRMLAAGIDTEMIDAFVQEPEDPEEMWGINYVGFIPDMLNVVAALLDRVEALENA